MSDHELMRQAIEAAMDSIRRGGGPFGAVVAREGRVVGLGANSVTTSNDPTAHAEIVAIRAACIGLGRFDLRGCAIYSTCEPCPMCLGAIYWARLDRIVYACTRSDAAAAGFDDDLFYRELTMPAESRTLRTEQLMRDEALAAFTQWRNLPGKVTY